MSIVYGTDFSPASERAMFAAAAIAERLQRSSGSFTRAMPAGIFHGADADQRGALEQRLKHAAQELAATFPELRVERAIVAGSAHRALVDFASTRQASMLVVASEGHGASPLAQLGGTSERLALEARCPILVLREPEVFNQWTNGRRPLRIVLGVGEPATTDGATAFVKRLRSVGACDVVVTHVYYPHDARQRYGLDRYLGFIQVDPSLEALIERDMAAQVGPLPGDGSVTFRPKLGVGRLADHLLEVAELERADLVVVGAHRRRNRFARLSAVSSGALHFGRMAVACVPKVGVEASPPNRVPSFNRVLVATDLSSFGNNAVRFGYSLVRHARGEVILLHVANAKTSTDERASIAARLRALVPGDGPAMAQTRTEIALGSDAAVEITAAAERFAVDAVCIASHGQAGVLGAVLGSVATRVAAECRKPVLLVHPPRD